MEGSGMAEGAPDLGSFFALAPDVLTVVDLDAVCTEINPAGERALGRPRSELVGRSLLTLVHPEDRERTADAMRKLARPGAEVRIENRYLHADGHEVWLDWTAQGCRGGLVYAGARDVSDQRRSEEALARQQAVWQDMFDHAPVGLCLLDAGGTITQANPELGRFLGAAAGGLVGEQLWDFVSEGDVAAAHESLQRLRDGHVRGYRAERVFRRADGGSAWGLLGITEVTAADGSPMYVLQVTDISERMRDEERTRDELEEVVWAGRIKTALDHDRMLVYAQPIVDLVTGLVVREELLVRMVDEGGAPVSAARFVPVAEKFGLIVELDAWMVLQAIDLCRAGRAVNVNLSARSIEDGRILELLLREAAQEPWERGKLCFEITETALAHEMDVFGRFAEQAGALGCELAIDDFGVGYGSLSYLRRLKGVACLKIDRSFVTGVVDNAQDQVIVRALLGLARSLDQYVVAEGVETPEVAAWLAAEGIRFAQGYGLGRPEPVRAAAVTAV